MNKQEQIEKLASLMADCNTTCDKCFEKLESVMTLPIPKRENYCQVYAYAQRAVEQGYRKTFTSDLASDTQKAFKEGYEKARKETAKEILNDLYFNLQSSVKCNLAKSNDYYNVTGWIQELAKEYGVEVEE